MKLINRNYNPNILTVTTERKEIAYLPGIGKFCKCGCGKRIEPVKVRSIVKGKIVTFKRFNKNKIFATPYCNKKYHSKEQRHPEKNSLTARMSLRVYYDKLPYRIISVYLKKGIKIDIRITSKDKSLWQFLEKCARDRRTPGCNMQEQTSANMIQVRK